MTQLYSNNNGTLTFKDYLTKTFSILGIGLFISAAVAYVCSLFILPFLYMAGSLAMLLIFGICIGEIAIAVYFTKALSTMSKSTAWTCYIVYSILTGLSLSTIFLTYDIGSVALAFIVTAIMFVCMSIIGHTTSVDLSKFTSLISIGLISLIIVTLINTFFIHSSVMDLFIAYIGVALFLVIIAMDMQKLRNYYNYYFCDSDMAKKAMIMGSFQLYLDFINLFIRILQIFGRRNDR